MRSFRACSVVAAAISALALFYLFGHQSSEPVVGRYSVAASLGIVAAMIVLGCALTLAVLPAAKMSQFEGWLEEGVATLGARGRQGDSRVMAVCCTLALVSFVILAVPLYRSNQVPRFDQLEYLKLADQIHQSGPIGFPRAVLSGEFTEANRHPLFPSLLATVADNPKSRFVVGKSLNVVIALTVWMSAAGICWRFWGPGPAAVTAVLLASNATLLTSATIISCEPVLALVAIWLWFAVLNANGWRGWLIVGLLLGALYWVKGSAILLVPGLLMGWCLSPKHSKRSDAAQLRSPRILTAWTIEFFQNKWRGLAALLAGFVICTFPLLVRNSVVYSNPLYNFNTRYLFADQFDPNQPYNGFFFELRRYTQTHSPGEIAARATSGVVWEGYIVLRSAAPAVLSTSRALVGIVVLAAAVVGILLADASQRWLIAIWVGVFYGFFAWYVPIAAGDRFWAPLMPILLCYAGRGLSAVVAVKSQANFDRTILGFSSLWVFIVITIGVVRSL